MQNGNNIVTIYNINKHCFDQRYFSVELKMHIYIQTVLQEYKC